MGGLILLSAIGVAIGYAFRQFYLASIQKSDSDSDSDN